MRPATIRWIAPTLAATMVLTATMHSPAVAPGPKLPKHVTRESVKAVDKAMSYLIKTQRPDGSWINRGGYSRYPVAMTSLAALALMAGGSTPEDGPHARQVKRAMLYVLRVAERSRGGLIAAGARSMYGHGFSMLFLAQCYGVESGADYGERIRTALNKAVALTCKSQSSRGGWIYTPDGNDDEGSVTVTQLQALRACRNAGIKVPRETIDRAVQYLRDCQNPDGGICYSLDSRGGSRPAISAAAIACFYAAGVYERDNAGAEAKAVERLITYCRRAVRVDRYSGHYFYTHYYMAQAMYQRGGDDYDQYYPTIRDRLIRTQNKGDGSWNGDGVGTVYGTALAGVILQLPYGYLPIYQR